MTPLILLCLGFLVNLGEHGTSASPQDQFPPWNDRTRHSHGEEHCVTVKTCGNIRAELKVVINLMLRLNLAFLGK